MEKEEGTNKVWAEKQINTMKAMSPTSLVVTLSQLRRGAKMDIADCFKMEYAMSSKFCEKSDFVEGVTSKLVTKTAPKWEPPFSDILSIEKNVGILIITNYR